MVSAEPWSAPRAVQSNVRCGCRALLARGCVRLVEEFDDMHHRHRLT